MAGETKFVSLIFVASFPIVDCQFGHPVVLRISHYRIIIKSSVATRVFPSWVFPGIVVARIVRHHDNCSGCGLSL